MRGFEGGPDGVEIIAIGADRPEAGDGETVRDRWTDRTSALTLRRVTATHRG